MFRARRADRKQLTAAWIALLSMLLLVVAPVFSQLQLAGATSHHAHPPAHEHPTHAHMPAMEHDARGTLQAPENYSGSHADHDPLGHALEACGYCFLLTNSPTLVAAVGVILTTQFVAGLSIDLRAFWQAPRSAAYVPHRPRGPPRSLTVR